ncbi:hypothetical protein CAPTEDRAFT_216936, partial [Capitella teleta]
MEDTHFRLLCYDIRVHSIKRLNYLPADIDHVYLHNVVRYSLILITGSTQHRTLNASDKGRDDFWTEVQKMRGNNSATPTIVDDCLSEDDIALWFREKYNTLYNS